MVSMRISSSTKFTGGLLNVNSRYLKGIIFLSTFLELNTAVNGQVEAIKADAMRMSLFISSLAIMYELPYRILVNDRRGGVSGNLKNC